MEREERELEERLQASSRVGVEGPGFSVQGWGSGFRVQGLGFRSFNALELACSPNPGLSSSGARVDHAESPRPSFSQA